MARRSCPAWVDRDRADGAGRLALLLPPYRRLPRAATLEEQWHGLLTGGPQGRPGPDLDITALPGLHAHTHFAAEGIIVVVVWHTNDKFRCINKTPFENIPFFISSCICVSLLEVCLFYNFMAESRPTQ